MTEKGVLNTFFATTKEIKQNQLIEPAFTIWNLQQQVYNAWENFNWRAIAWSS